MQEAAESGKTPLLRPPTFERLPGILAVSKAPGHYLQEPKV
jgi:hypothetical protein